MRGSFASFILRRRLSTTAALNAPPPSTSVIDTSPAPSKPISHLKYALLSESDPEKIVDLLQSSTNLPRFHSSRPLYDISIKKLYRCRRLDLVERLLESQKAYPAAPKSEGFFIRIMLLYTNASMPDLAFRTFEQIPGTVRTEKSLCALLTAFLKQRRFDQVRDLFNRIPGEFCIFPGVAAHNIYISALSDSGEMDDARKVLDELPKKGLQPDVISYNVVLSGYLKKEDGVGFVDTFKEMNSKGIAPNVVTYNLRMLNFCKRLESFKAEELLEVMISKGIRPYVLSFNIIIDGFCKEGNLESATRVFKRMKSMKRAKGERGFLPNADTYVMLIRGLVDSGDFTSAEEICRESLIRKYVPPFETLKALINGLVKDSKVIEAKYLFDKMRKAVKGSAVNSWTKLEAEWKENYFGSSDIVI
ncbi:pentatricopeptide repeat-containing protein At1g55890, mitochondrial-like [Phalaenopsis equestris]|uniref:pentatricopeptide repeat-containing protein At1g55890, mitochondrial-like n=1 Tax=Phalaenopsis equestris TaxID=78828 RepID=UPI0009E43FFF|nr:pentatricopeptide repeat-containing protein At1g55890, mitochondrial-like [Phalaenopsis equestris]